MRIQNYAAIGVGMIVGTFLYALIKGNFSTVNLGMMITGGILILVQYIKDKM